MEIFSKIFTRLNITIVLLAAQITVFAIFMNRVINFVPFIVGISYLLGAVIVCGLCEKRVLPLTKSFGLLL